MNAHCLVEAPEWSWGSPNRIKSDSWARIDASALRSRTYTPGRAYSKRSKKLNQLRLEAAKVGEVDFEDAFGVTSAAMASAEAFINNLWEGCLEFSLEISHDGEVNFLFGDSDEFFHIHIDEEGALSYYAHYSATEKMGSRLDPSQFPQAELLAFVDRRK